MTLEALQAQTTCEHPTPQGILQAARDTFSLGRICFDPASSQAMNEFVKADWYYTKEFDGFDRTWQGFENCFLNPPGSQTAKGEPRGRSPLEWLDKLVGHLEAGDLKEAIYIGYNAAETLSKRPHHCRRAAIIHSSIEHCGSSDIDRLTNNGRIKFLGDSPFFPSVILYFGWNQNAFCRNFARFGTRIIVP